MTLASLALVLNTALAQEFFGLAQEDPDNPWQEAPVQLPPMPQDVDLQPFYVSGTATQAFAVDERSIRTDLDGVVRFTLVSRSSAGAVNTSYEGIRCRTREVKQYAFGRADGSWVEARTSKWKQIAGTHANRYHAVLARDFFCDDRAVKGNEEAIRFLLRNQQSVTPY
ncbi:MAG TPA: CNP1-like family protein [Noviherbaspirillum sp.]